MSRDLRALVVGPRDKTKISRFGRITPDRYEGFLSEIASSLAQNVGELILIPDEGVPLDIARACRKVGGVKTIGYVPKNDPERLRPYFGEVDEIKTLDGGWSALNTCLSLNSDLVTAFGLSPGTVVELSYTSYHREYGGKEIPIFVDSRTIGSRLPLEVEEEINISYFGSVVELNGLFQKLRGK